MKYILAFSLALAFSTHTAAQTYVVGVEDTNFMPHYGFDKWRRYSGFARDLLDLFAEQTDVKLVYKALPTEELGAALVEGKIDFKYPDNPDWARSDGSADALSYSDPIVEYVDGVLVTPRRAGLAVEHLKRLALVEGWTPLGYQEQIESSQILAIRSDSLQEMVRQTLLKNSDGAYYNVVVALHYINNIRARPDVLVFDPNLPHTRSAFRLSTMKQTELLQRFDDFLKEQQADIEALKAKHQVEAHIDSQYLGMEQWKIDFLKRQETKDAEEK
ncbi:transporter substrate-binding domain-containing protein [Marinobacter fonticola]|uniref:transporter substrate-binding domain-containing protein n=1 Tax=Marinobacter fonticola TaxID=2603215 RepID=UPI0011E712C4|nr:transporter substrate-binding domain-containing protein [Marinobacter fonticola]